VIDRENEFARREAGIDPLDGQNALFTGSFAAFKNAHVGCANCANVDSLPFAGTNSSARIDTNA